MLSLFFVSTHADAKQNILPRALYPSSTPAPCPSEDSAHHNDAKRKYEDAYRGEKNFKITFKNVLTLHDSPSKVSILDSVLGNPQPLNWLDRAKNCSTAFCVVRSLVDSDESAYRLLTIPKVSSVTFTLSPREAGYDHQTANRASSIWTKEELRQFSRAIEITPTLLKSVPKKVRVFRTGVRDGYDAANTSAMMDIRIYNDAFTMGDLPFDESERTTYLQKVIIHELCHVFDQQSQTLYNLPGILNPYLINETNVADHSIFSASFQFKERTKLYKNQVVSHFVEDDYYEDFAETCAYFVANPKTLLKRAPDKYRIIRDLLFSGQDFSNETWNQPLYSNLDSYLTSESSESACEADLVKFVQNSIEIDSHGVVKEVIPAGVNGNPTTSSRTYPNWPNGSTLIGSIQENRLIEFLPVAKQDPEFCAKGGAEALRKRFRSACQKSISRLKELTRHNHGATLTLSSARCAHDRNLSTQCLHEKQKKSFIDRYGNTPLANAVADKVQYGIFSTSLRLYYLDTLNVADWLPSCFSKIFSVELNNRRLTYTLKSEIQSTTASDHTVTFSPLHAPAYFREIPAAALSCFESMHEALKATGYTFGENLSQVEIATLLSESKTYRKYIESFETSVLIPLIYSQRMNPNHTGYSPLAKSPRAKRFVRTWLKGQSDLRKADPKPFIKALPLY